MDILVRISTTFYDDDPPSEAYISGLVPLLNAILQTADERRVESRLEAEYGLEVATDFLDRLLPKIGEVVGVEVVPAAGESEEERVRYEKLTGAAFTRAEEFLCEYWHPLRVDRAENLRLYQPGKVLVGFVVVEGTRMPVRHPIFGGELRRILYGEGV